MTQGLVEFEFDLPGALLKELISVLASTEPAPLLPANLNTIPEQQGVYQLLLKKNDDYELVYIGKTDAEAGLSKRLQRHYKKIQHRRGISPEDVFFKAVRVFVFTVADLETDLIKHYGGVSSVPWNGSGFGSNDPGRKRDTSDYKEGHFDSMYPIDVGLELEGIELPADGSAAEILKCLKMFLPYTLRYETISGRSLQPHPDLEATKVELPPHVTWTALEILETVVENLPPGWHATKLPSHIIMYKNDTRNISSGIRLAFSG